MPTSVQPLCNVDELKGICMISPSSIYKIRKNGPGTLLSQLVQSLHSKQFSWTKKKNSCLRIFNMGLGKIASSSLGKKNSCLRIFNMGLGKIASSSLGQKKILPVRFSTWASQVKKKLTFVRRNFLFYTYLGFSHYLELDGPGTFNTVLRNGQKKTLKNVLTNGEL